jgi:hypothetical protein
MSEERTELFHGKFILSEPPSLPLGVRAAIGVGLGIVIVALAFISMDVLDSLGVWVTLLLVSVMTAAALVIWIRDSVKPPPGTAGGTGGAGER